jgi:hypothetical protein
MATLAPDSNLCAVLKSIVLNIAGKHAKSRGEPFNDRAAHLDGHQEGFAGIALCAFEAAQIKTRLVRLDAGQPHRFAASAAVQNSDLRNAKKWIGLSGKHDAPLWTGRERDTLSHRLLPMMGR